MVGRASVFVIDPATYQTHPGFSITHSLKGLRIECNDCMAAKLANHAPRNATLHYLPDKNPRAVNKCLPCLCLRALLIPKKKLMMKRPSLRA